MLSHIRQSGTAHTLKDLEKTLPSIASINSMQVKDYIQALLDDDEIKVEKIGSGNWYWCFPGEAGAKRLEAKQRAAAEHQTVLAELEIVESRIANEEEARAEEKGEVAGKTRKDHIALLKQLEADIAVLKLELASYSDNDPVEIEKQAALLLKLKEDAETYTDQILSMEDWVKTNGGTDKESFVHMMRTWYGDQYNEEEQGLHELS